MPRARRGRLAQEARERQQRRVEQVEADIQRKALRRIEARLAGDDRTVNRLDRDLDGDRNHPGLWDEKRGTLAG
jgi:hypothetical protein